MALKENSEKKDYRYIGIELNIIKRFKKYKPADITNSKFLKNLLIFWKNKKK